MWNWYSAFQEKKILFLLNFLENKCLSALTIQFVAHVLESRFSPGRPQRHYKLTHSVSCHWLKSDLFTKFHFCASNTTKASWGRWIAEISILNSRRTILKSSSLNSFQLVRIWPDQPVSFQEKEAGLWAEFSCDRKCDATNRRPCSVTTVSWAFFFLPDISVSYLPLFCKTFHLACQDKTMQRLKEFMKTTVNRNFSRGGTVRAALKASFLSHKPFFITALLPGSTQTSRNYGRWSDGRGKKKSSSFCPKFFFFCFISTLRALKRFSHH